MGEKSKSELFAEAKELIENHVAKREGRSTLNLKETTAQYSVGFAKIWELTERLAAKSDANTARW